MFRRKGQLSWDDIEAQARKRHGLGRRRRRGRLLGPMLVVGLLVAVGVVVAGATGRGPYASLAARDSAAPTETAGTTGPVGTTTIEYLLDGREYRPGDCVAWDQDAPPGPYHRTDVVPCDEDHLIEIVARVLVSGASDRVPTLEEWSAIIDHECGAVVQDYFGGPIDPFGRFEIGAIQPGEQGWRAGDRDAWCGLQAHWAPPEQEQQVGGNGLARTASFRGTARAASQFWSYAPGECLGAHSFLALSCREPHTMEVVGTVTLPDSTALPAPDDHAGWQALVGDGCAGRARTYLGGPVPEPWLAGHLQIAPESWAAGRRTVPCVLGQSGETDWLSVTGSARAKTA